MNADHADAAGTGIAFAPGVAEAIGFYVYLLIDPRDDRVFYVGKGTGDRCFAHLLDARATVADPADDYLKLDRIREILSTGREVRIDVLRHGLSEHEAYLVESAAIDLLEDLTNEVVGHGAAARGRMTVANINANYGATPVTIAPDHRVVLIRINKLFERGMSDDALYEATRKWWVVGPGRRNLGTPLAPDWAMAVYGGIVRAVYRIRAWESGKEAAFSIHQRDLRRWAFRGERDAAMEAIYLSRDVSAYLRARSSGNASQNPIRYVNCNYLAPVSTDEFKTK